MSWVEHEFENIDLGDKRLNKRVLFIGEALGLAPGKTIPQTFQAWKELKACYNFLSNNSFSEKELLAPHIEKTIERISEFPVALLLTDTSEVKYTTKKSMKGKSRLSNKDNGIWLHPTIAVTPDRLNCGTIDVNFWERAPEAAEDSSAYRQARDKAPIEEKESYRWLQSYQRTCEIAKTLPGTQIINIMDREGDIIEIFEESAEQKKQGGAANFIIRSNHDRLLKDEIDSENEIINSKLRQRLIESPSLGTIEFNITKTEKRMGRKVTQTLKAISVSLKPKAKKIEVTVNAVMAIEENPPPGEDPLIWVLITDLPIDSFENACLIIKYYLCRWEIELFFRVLKGGCKIEDRELQEAERMKKLIAIFMIMSWRVMYTMMLGRICPEISAGDLFEEAEWKSVYKILNKKKPLPRKPPQLNEFIIMIGILGGYVPGKKAEPPGVKTMWTGMARMMDFAIAWEAFGGS